MKHQTQYTIRNMDWDDLPRLTGMDSGSPHPWTYADLARAMESPYALGVVATCANQLAGFMIYLVSDGTNKAGRKQNRLALTVGLLKLTVAEAWRRKGVATFLINTVESQLVKQFSKQSPHGRIRMTATVPETWLTVQLFLKHLGFRVPQEDGVQRSPFDHCDDDGYVFERRSEWTLDSKPPPMSVAANGAKAA